MLTKVKKLYLDAQLPTKGYPADAGYDLFVHRIEETENIIKVYSGVAVQPEVGYFYLLFPRSSISKKGLVMHNSVGVVDQNYAGEIIAVFMKTDLYKTGNIKIGERVVQLVPQRQIETTFEEVVELVSLDRGTGGFGSSDKK